MGFISIFGIAVQDALIVVTYAQRLWDDGHGLETGAREAAQRRLRPLLMTTFVTMLGLTPAALSHGIGADTQKPLAIVVIGDALILAVLPRLLQPALLVLAHVGEKRWTRKSAKDRALDAQSAETANEPTESRKSSGAPLKAGCRLRLSAGALTQLADASSTSRAYESAGRPAAPARR